MTVHAKSRLTLEPLRTLRSETKGQAEPARTGRGPAPVRVRLTATGANYLLALRKMSLG
jgi:hypothetical protein